MKITTIYEDTKTTVKNVEYNGKFLYTRTYIKDSEGYARKSITVFANGKIDIQNY